MKEQKRLNKQASSDFAQTAQLLATAVTNINAGYPIGAGNLAYMQELAMKILNSKENNA